MKLQFFHVQVFDKDNKLVYSTSKTGFTKQEAIRSVATHFEDKSGTGTGLNYSKYEYPLTFKATPNNK